MHDAAKPLGLKAEEFKVKPEQMPTSGRQPGPFCEASHTWYQALQVKRMAAILMVQSQSVIEDCEADWRKLLPEEEISNYCSLYYSFGSDQMDMGYLSTISNIPLHVAKSPQTSSIPGA
ncbi:hypothetical protein HYDPIDRAFT_31837 [Hydnomerulius pinastri MD-312]|uniref:Uncharacterized protein n=1 Tax=Hydnomerulius pinastri MD-312 TaxID=994086 RepID=A0A0C9WB80_9AGAM|nr:hypothetical protein HYDPIDRAFT_31837 [Hydnomerulius pinastri MD-312]